MYTETELLEDTSLCLDDLVLYVDVVLVKDKGLDGPGTNRTSHTLTRQTAIGQLHITACTVRSNSQWSQQTHHLSQYKHLTYSFVYNLAYMNTID